MQDTGRGVYISMVNQIALGILLVGQIALAGCVIYLNASLEKVAGILEKYRELFRITRDTLQVISTEQDKHADQIGITEERVLNLLNKYGQMSIQIKKMADKAIYEADHERN